MASDKLKQPKFVGNFKHNVDAKGRMFVPAKFRKNLGENVILTYGFENNLILQPHDEWLAYAEEFMMADYNDIDARRKQRFIVGRASEVEVDKQGRIILTADMRKYADIGDEVFVVGLGKRIELWNEQEYFGYEVGKESVRTLIDRDAKRKKANEERAAAEEAASGEGV